MRHPETHLVTADHGPRPAGSPDHCFYCGVPVGCLHELECVMRERTVVVRMIVEYAVKVPESWEPSQIEFHRNEGSWCSNNGLNELENVAEVNDSADTCLCDLVRYEYVREATEEDEARAISKAPLEPAKFTIVKEITD